ncbi:MAG: YesL family protein [Clostridiales bacterium]|nr:YesL family protein [Clostridiales bacterium]
MAKRSLDHITNSWLYRASKAVGDVVIISALFLLFCLPVVTAGASVTALYYTVYHKYYKKTDNITKDFMHSLKDNLKNGIIVHLIYLIYSAVVGFNIYFAFFGWGDIRLPDWYIPVSLLPLLPVVFTLPFVYALMARFDNGIKGTVKNSFTLCMMNFPKFILIWLIVILALAISIGFPPAALVIPAGAAYLCQMITEKAFTAAIDVENSRGEENE